MSPIDLGGNVCDLKAMQFCPCCSFPSFAFVSCHDRNISGTKTNTETSKIPLCACVCVCNIRHMTKDVIHNHVLVVSESIDVETREEGKQSDWM